MAVSSAAPGREGRNPAELGPSGGGGGGGTPAAPGGRGGDQPADGGLLGSSRPRGEEPGVAGPIGRGSGGDHVGVLGVRDQQSVEGRDLPQGGPQPGLVERRELRNSGVEQEALEPDDA